MFCGGVQIREGGPNPRGVQIRCDTGTPLPPQVPLVSPSASQLSWIFVLDTTSSLWYLTLTWALIRFLFLAKKSKQKEIHLKRNLNKYAIEQVVKQKMLVTAEYPSTIVWI